jgi:hypothetical protein
MKRLTESVRCQGNIGIFVYRQCHRRTKTTYDDVPLCHQHRPKDWS